MRTLTLTALTLMTLTLMTLTGCAVTTPPPRTPCESMLVRALPCPHPLHLKADTVASRVPTYWCQCPEPPQEPVPPGLIPHRYKPLRTR